jgi:hypothetical protein
MIRTTLLSLVVTLAAIPASAQPGPVKTLAHDVKQDLGTLRKDLDGAFGGLGQALAELRAELTAGNLSAADAQDALATELDAVQAAAGGHLSAFSDAVEADASAGLQGLLVQPEPFLVGEGLLGQTVVKAHKLLVRDLSRAVKRVHGFTFHVQKQQKYDMVVDLRAPVLPAFTPSANATEAPAPRQPFRIDLLLGGSEKLVAADGLLMVGGTADATVPGDVTVSLERPGDVPVVVVASVDPTSGRWLARFDGLPRGNHAIDASFNGSTISDSLGLP